MYTIDIDQFERITLEEWWSNAQKYETVHPQAHVYAFEDDEFKYQYLKHNHPEQIPSLDHMEQTMIDLGMDWDATVSRLFRLSRKVGLRFIPLLGWGLAAKDVYDLVTD